MISSIRIEIVLIAQAVSRELSDLDLQLTGSVGKLHHIQHSVSPLIGCGVSADGFNRIRKNPMLDVRELSAFRFQLSFRIG
jgi:hypothetical protein